MIDKAISNRDVVDLVRKYVDQNQPREFRLVVLDEAVMHVTEGPDDRSDRWYVVVRPDPELPRLLEQYTDAVDRIESQIKDKEGVDVFLQSVLPAY